jgi:hypothetical protein
MKRAALMLVALVLAGALIAAQPQRPSSPPRPSGGNGTLYIGGYPNLIWIIDEATEKIIGTIRTKGIPRRLGLTRDRQRFYIVDATTEVVDVVDIASRATRDTFTLSEGNKRVRITSMEPDPSNRYAILLTRTATKLRDRRSCNTT